MDELDICILKAILNNKNYALEFAHECSEKLFVPDLLRFSKAIIDFVRVYKDTPSKRVLLEKIDSTKNKAFLEHATNIFARIEKCNYNDKDYKHDLEKLKERYSKKLIVSLKDNLTNSETLDVKRSVNDIQTVLNGVKGINQPKAYKDGSLKDYVDDFKNIYAAKLQNPEFGAGIKTGYTFIDYATGGLKGGQLLLFAGITNSGKSLLISNACMQIYLQGNTIDMTGNFGRGYNVLLFSLEMNYNEYMNRLLARMCLVPEMSIRDATLTDEHKARISKAFKFIKSYNHTFKVIDLPRKATMETISIILDEQEEMGFKPDVVAIDYLNLMDADGGKDNSDWLIQANISSAIHEASRVRNIPIISAVQLNPNKGDGKDGSEFGVKSLRRSSSIADNANFIIAINTRKNEKNYPELSCSFIKNRSGPLLSGNLHKELECCALLDQKIDNISSDPSDISSSMESFI